MVGKKQLEVSATGDDLQAPTGDFDGMMEGHVSGSLGKRVNEAGRIRFAMVASGFDAMSQVWPHEHYVWSSMPDTVWEHTPRDQRGTIYMGPPARVKKSVLRDHPVDALLVDVGVPVELWMSWLDDVALEELPETVVAMFPGDCAVREDHGEELKSKVKTLQRLGFQCQLFSLNALDFGASVGQERLAYVFSRDGPCPIPICHQLPVRPMRNLLRDHLVPQSAFAPPKHIRAKSQHTLGPYVVCARVRQQPVYDASGPMPDSLAWVQDSRRIRKLMPAERARALGLDWDVAQVGKVGSRLQVTTGIHLWASIVESLVLMRSVPESSAPVTASSSSASTSVPMFQSDPVEWSWSVPDLSPGSKWYQDRVASLHAAVDGLPDADQLITEGLAALDVHRTNYTSEGPKRLQLLWWEFPPEHQEAVRCGSSMNFLVLPSGELVLNNDMDEKQLEVAAKFVDQLVALGVLVEADTILANCPLFCVSKAGQPDEFRCIADMRRGGQNECIASDPVYFQRGHDILNCLYAGGYSAVADQSKYFHNYLTRPSERPYMGTIHPVTNQLYVYRGLPMGSSNSPAIACRIGNSFLRMLRAECDAFQGVPTENSWRVKLQGDVHHTEWGYGRVLVGSDGLPACHVWAHVDDYFIHGPTKQKTCRAFAAFMDLSVRMGFIVQPCKTSPPAQVQTYCGFEYDTSGRPILRIPQSKQQRALASIDYIQRFRGLNKDVPGHDRLARLTLAVVLGRLQSLVDATPQRVGQAYLRRLYTEMHVTSGDPDELQHAIKVFGSAIDLSSLAWSDLDWWRESLVRNCGVSCLASAPGATAVTWGDGSGTGGGGTLELDDDAPNLEFWMGTWSPHVASFSSNWKELRTLLEMLRREQGTMRLCNGIMFYFTDNLVTYYIVQGGSSSSTELHKLIRMIKQLESRLGCQVEVIHVPGKLMIRQGADGLSRGIRVTPERMERSTFLEASRVLSAVPYNPAWMIWAFHQLPVIHALPWRHVGSLDSWDFHLLAGHMTFWTPSPEIARQAITCFLQSWCEQPTTMGAVFCIPRVMQRIWGNLSRHIQELGVFDPEVLPSECCYESLIPVVLLYVPPFVHSLPSARVDAPSVSSKLPRWAQRQADGLRGMC